MFAVEGYTTPRHRQHSINLSISASNKHRYSRKALYCCIDLADRYLTAHPAKSQSEMTAVYIVCLYVGAKMEEVEFPCHKIYLSGTGIKLDQFVELEIRLLDHFDWKMNTVSIMTFFDMLARSYKLCPLSLSFAQYVAEIMLYEYTYINLKKSHIAAGILYLMLKLFFGLSWSKDLQIDTRYSKKQVLEAVSLITSTLNQFWSKDEKYQANLNSRFSTEAFSHISEFRLVSKKIA